MGNIILHCHVDRQLDDDIRYEANSGGVLSNNSDEIRQLYYHNRYEANSGGVLSNNSDEIAEREQLSDLLHDTV